MNVRSGKYTRANRPRVVGVITSSIMHALSSSLHYFLITSSFVLYLFHPIAYPLLPNIFILPFFFPIHTLESVYKAGSQFPH